MLRRSETGELEIPLDFDALMASMQDKIGALVGENAKYASINSTLLKELEEAYQKIAELNQFIEAASLRNE